MEEKEKDSRPVVSVIVPVYNVEKYLPVCADSILAQTYTRLEIILVNDGSKDKSPKICDAYATKDSRVKVIHKNNGGLVSAWTAGVKEAVGEYLLFIDSDDWMEEKMVEELLSYTVSGKKEVICSNYIIEKIEKNKSVPVTQKMEPGIYERNEIEKKILPNLLGREERIIHFSRCMKLISKELVIGNMKFLNHRLTMGEDVSIILPVLMDAERIVIVKEGYYYHYRFVEASMAHKYQPDLYRQVHLLGENLKETIREKFARSKEKQIELFMETFRREYIFLMFYVIKNELRGPGKGRIQRLKHIIQEEKNSMGLYDTKIEATSKAGKLLSLIWKKPDAVRVTIGRIAISIFDSFF